MEHILSNLPGMLSEFLMESKSTVRWFGFLKLSLVGLLFSGWLYKTSSALWIDCLGGVSWQKHLACFVDLNVLNPSHLFFFFNALTLVLFGWTF